MGRTVLMKFPNDKYAIRVPVELVEKAQRENNAEVVLSPFQKRLRQAYDLAPTAGSIAGSVAGGATAAGLSGPAAPVAAMGGRWAGGTAGGILGKVAQEGLYRISGMGDAPGSIQDAIKQEAINNAAGEGLGLAGGVIGRTAYGTALAGGLKNVSRAVNEAVAKNIPIAGGDIAGALGVRKLGAAFRKIPVVGSTLVHGGTEATQNLWRAAKIRNDILESAYQQGVRVPRKIVEDAIKDMVYKSSREMGSAGEVNMLKKLLKSWQDRKLDMIDPREMKDILTHFNRRAAPYWRALERGVAEPSAKQTARAEYYTGVSDAVTKWMKDNVPRIAKGARRVGPTYRDAMRSLADGINLRNAVRATEADMRFGLPERLLLGSTLGLAAGSMGGHGDHETSARLSRQGITTALGAMTLMHPAVASRLGLAIARSGGNLARGFIHMPQYFQSQNEYPEYQGEPVQEAPPEQNPVPGGR